MTTYAGNVVAFPRRVDMGKEKQGNSFFTLGSDKPVTEDQAKQFQERYGYPVDVYGFHEFNQEYIGVKYMAHWWCGSASASPRGVSHEEN